MQIVLRFFCSASLLAALASGQNSAADDPRIQKQAPFHWGTPPPNHRVKLDFVPIRVLASVRHESAVRHVPREESLAEASTPEEIILAKRLKEAITTKKLGEVYTEQGYEDQNYDHGNYEKHGKYDEKFENRDKGQHNQHNYDGSVPKGQYNYQGAASSQPIDLSPLHTIVRPAKKVITTTAAPEVPAPSKKYPFYHSAAKNSPQRYASNPKLLPDKKNNPDMPFYASTNYKECPEISPVLSVGPDDKNPKGEPRLRGLGDKIDCLVSKYFGADPFDNPFFKEETVHAANINPKQILPSESNNGPVTFVTDATYMEMAQNEAKARKARKGKNKKRQKPTAEPKYYPNHRQVAAATEEIEGMLPPPLPLRVRKTRSLGATSIYSTVRGGVKFISEPDEALLVLPSHRVNTNTKFGVKEGTARSYEVTEEPEETSFKFLQTSKAFPTRQVKVERHRITQEDHGLYSSTYIPEPSVHSSNQDPITTTVWNAVPTSLIDPENIELSSSISSEILTTTPNSLPEISSQRSSEPAGRSSRGRTRTSGHIPEDIFQGRGERRIQDAPSQQETQRNRQRNSVVRTPKRYEMTAIDSKITQVSKYSADPDDAIPTEEISIRNQKPRRQHNRRPPPLAGDKPEVPTVGNSLAPRRKNRPKAGKTPEVEVTDAPIKVPLPVTDLPAIQYTQFPDPPPFIPQAESFISTEYPEVFSQEPVSRLPETTIAPTEPPTTTTFATTTTAASFGGRPRARGNARERGDALEASLPRKRGPSSEAKPSRTRGAATEVSPPRGRGSSSDTAAPREKSSFSETVAPRKSAFSESTPPRERGSFSETAAPRERASPSEAAPPRERVAFPETTAPRERGSLSEATPPRVKVAFSETTAPKERGSPSEATPPREKVAFSETTAPRERGIFSESAAPRERGPPSEATPPRPRSRDSARAAPADQVGGSDQRRVNRRREQQRSRSGNNFDANSGVAFNAPESTEFAIPSATSRQRVSNQRSHATSPAAATDHQQEPSPSARGRRTRLRAAVNREEEAAA